ncbi:MAG: hypothetical protein WCL04_09255 [Verrucomicrobiota bacterium]
MKLHLPAVTPLLDVVKVAADSLGGCLAAPLRHDGLDAEFRSDWEAELVAAQNEDIRLLLALFGHEFFGTGVIVLDEANAEPVMRACAALRLRLRAHDLGALPDEALESGAVHVAGLAEPVQRAFMSYVFLATLQDLCLSHLGPSVPGV